MSKTLSKTAVTAELSARVQDILSTPVLTVQDVRKGGIDVQSTLSAIREREATVSAIGTPVMTDKALHVFYVTSTKGIIGKDGGVWARQGDYAEAAGLSPAYVTRLKRLGRAMVDFGVKQGDKRYTFLAQFGDKSNVGDVFKAIDALPDTATAAERRALFTKGMDAAMTPTPAVESREAQPPTGGETSTVEETPATTETREPTADDLLNALDRLAKAATREEWAAMENRMTAIITRENTLRSRVEK